MEYKNFSHFQNTISRFKRDISSHPSISYCHLLLRNVYENKGRLLKKSVSFCFHNSGQSVLTHYYPPINIYYWSIWFEEDRWIMEKQNGEVSKWLASRGQASYASQCRILLLFLNTKWGQKLLQMFILKNKSQIYI